MDDDADFENDEEMFITNADDRVIMAIDVNW